MSPYTHFTLKERETILLGLNSGLNQATIAKSLERSKKLYQSRNFA